MKTHFLIFLVSIISLTLFSCENIISPEEQEKDQINKEAKIKLIQIDVPDYVFSIADEVISFKTFSEKLKEGEKESVMVDISSLRKKINLDFETIFIVQENPNGKYTTELLKVGKENFFQLEIANGNFYHIYAGLGRVYTNTYATVCDLSSLFPVLKPAVLNRICLVILCSNIQFYANEIFTRIPELREFEGNLDFSGRVIGNFPLSNPCKDCFSNARVIPCLPYIPGGGVEESEETEILDYVIQYNPGSGSVPDQIYTVENGGGILTNLSRSVYNEREPDLSDDGKYIMFSSERNTWDTVGRTYPALVVMDIDGSNQQEIPGIFGADPKFASLDEFGNATIIYKSFHEEFEHFIDGIFKLEYNIITNVVTSNTLLRQGNNIYEDYRTLDIANGENLIYSARLASEYGGAGGMGSFDISMPLSDIDIIYGWHTFPTVSPDGTRLLSNFHDVETGDNFLTYRVLNLDGTFGSEIYNYPFPSSVAGVTSFGNMDINDSNLQVAFSGDEIIYQLNTDGTELLQVTPSGGKASHPNFIP